MIIGVTNKEICVGDEVITIAPITNCNFYITEGHIFTVVNLDIHNIFGTYYKSYSLKDLESGLIFYDVKSTNLKIVDKDFNSIKKEHFKIQKEKEFLLILQNNCKHKYHTMRTTDAGLTSLCPKSFQECKVHMGCIKYQSEDDQLIKNYYRSLKLNKIMDKYDKR